MHPEPYWKLASSTKAAHIGTGRNREALLKRVRAPIAAAVSRWCMLKKLSLYLLCFQRSVLEIPVVHFPTPFFFPHQPGIHGQAKCPLPFRAVPSHLFQLCVHAIRTSNYRFGFLPQF